MVLQGEQDILRTLNQIFAPFERITHPKVFDLVVTYRFSPLSHLLADQFSDAPFRLILNPLGDLFKQHPEEDIHLHSMNHRLLIDRHWLDTNLDRLRNDII
jgi:hypothetical protein